jgi:hypothetical protein
MLRCNGNFRRIRVLSAVGRRARCPEFGESKENDRGPGRAHGGGKVISKSRFVLALGLTLALGIAAVSYGSASKAVTATIKVIGAVNPTDAKGTQPSKPPAFKAGKFSPVKLYTAVSTTDNVTGTQSNPTKEFIQYSKNIKLNTNAVPQCTTLPPSGSTPQQAQAACGKSYLGSGTAELTTPGGGKISDVTVTTFAGKQAGDTRKDPGILLHTFSPTLGTAAPTVPGYITTGNPSKRGSPYKYALDVPNAPQTGSLQIDFFGSNIEKSNKSVTATCSTKKSKKSGKRGKSGKFQWLRTSTFDDGTKLTASTSQTCKVK